MMQFLSYLNDWWIADGVFTPFEVPFRKILNNKEVVYGLLSCKQCRGRKIIT